MRRFLIFANMGLLVLILLATAACGSGYGYAPATGPSSGVSSSPEASSDSQNAPTPPPMAYQSPLTAGQVDDNAYFDDYLAYTRNYTGPSIHDIDVERRLFVWVVDADKHPVAGARVQLFDGDHQVFDGRTVSDGRVLFFPNAVGSAQTQRFRGIVSRGQAQYDSNNITEQNPAPEVELSNETMAGTVDNSGPVGIDMVFLLDATGSMGDEIDKIKTTVGSIAARIEQLPDGSQPRLGLVAYRDRGDDFVTRSWDFTDSVGQFSTNLSQVEAGGGGDNSESVSSGLHDAIHLPGWADNSTGRHLRMIVLVGDAPPHLDYPNDYEYTGLLNEAVAAGIKIFPIGASGLNEQGEYIFRQFAQVTQGQFVFLTYANGVSGAPGSATSDHVSNFTVKNLDSLVVGLVAKEVANQTGEAVQGSAGAEAASVAYTLPSEPPAPAPKAGPARAWIGLALGFVGFVALAFGLASSLAEVASNLVTNQGIALGISVLTAVIIRRRSNVEKARVAVPMQQALPLETRDLETSGQPTVALALGSLPPDIVPSPEK